MTGCWRHGIGEDRIECIGHTEGLDSHLSTYHRIDIALDTFPYNGTTTICEALWMGVPVITFAGDRHASRVGASLLTTLDLTELIAQDPAGYVDLAVRFAEDRAALDRVRTGLRERMRRAPLMDASGFCRSLEVQFQRMQGRCL
jgi:predicted O-linked N-acetylglucosamine transferase (SPINDLY family)